MLVRASVGGRGRKLPGELHSSTDPGRQWILRALCASDRLEAGQEFQVSTGDRRSDVVRPAALPGARLPSLYTSL